MDFDALAAGYAQAIPFNIHIGLRVQEIGEGYGVVVLPDGPATMNHVRSQHAGALFTAGEAASGAAFISAFAERMGDITATGRFADDREALFAELDREGRVRFGIAVELTDPEGTVVCEMTVRWHVRVNA